VVGDGHNPTGRGGGCWGPGAGQVRFGCLLAENNSDGRPGPLQKRILKQRKWKTYPPRTEGEDKGRKTEFTEGMAKGSGRQSVGALVEVGQFY